MMAPVPRLSTTVLLVRDGAHGLEVLMVVRNPQSHYSSALVFPGGVVDAADADDAWQDFLEGADGLDATERTRRIAGFRELYEETGLLLLDSAERQPEVGEQPRTFLDEVRRSGSKLDVSTMAPFAHWVTPEGSPKRFDTHFRLCWGATHLTAISDGRETVAVEWLRPVEAIALGASKRRNLLFPTKCQLDLLAQSSTVDEAVAAARGRRIVPVSPFFERRPDGMYFSIPPECGYPVPEFFVPTPEQT